MDINIHKHLSSMVVQQEFINILISEENANV